MEEKVIFFYKDNAWGLIARVCVCQVILGITACMYKSQKCACGGEEMEPGGGLLCATHRQAYTQKVEHKLVFKMQQLLTKYTFQFHMHTALYSIPIS